MAKLKKERKAAAPVKLKKKKAVTTSKGKAIPVTVVEDTRPITFCPETEDHPIQFRFKGQCPITTCQYCTRETANGCLSLDRKESADRPISNKEIAYYKRTLYPELKQLDQKQLDNLVRRSQTRTRTALCLNMFIAAIDDSDSDRSFQYIEGRSRIVDQVHNYLVQTFTDYRSWVLAYLDDEERFAEIVGKMTSSEFNLVTALRLTPRKYQTFCQALKDLKHSGESNE